MKPRFIVFILGGITYYELGRIDALAEETGADIVAAGTSMIGSHDLLRLLESPHLYEGDEE